MEVRVVFHRTGSRDFPHALEVARRQPGFREAEDATEFSVVFNQDRLDGYDELLAVVGRWSQTRLYLNGHAVDRPRLEHMLGCYRRRLLAPDRRAHCAGQSVHETRIGPVRQLFPCRLIPISEANHGGWFQYGRLTREGVFVLDKAQLRDAVKAALDRTLAVHCPALFPAEVDAVIDRLPDRIDPDRDPHWGYREGWQNGRFVRVGVEKRAVPRGGTPQAEPGEGRGRRGGRPRSGDVDLVDAGPEGADGVAEAEGPDRRGGGSTRPEPPAARDAAASGREARRRAADAGASAHRPKAPEIRPVRYEDIGGLAAQIRAVRETLELPLRFPELFLHLGIDPHRGILLSGPPGTGKTLLARALASECAASFHLVNGPEIISKWHGESEANLRRIFEEAKEAAPAVVLIDEIDSIAPDRSRVSHNHEAVLVSQLLTLLDGLVDRGQVVVVATTNRPELVDPAVRRPGRLDLLLEIGLPDLAARRDILRIHTGRMPLDPGVDIPALASATEGFAGAHLSSLCREAGLECMREVIVLDAEGAFTVVPDALQALTVRPEHFARALAVVAEMRRRGEAAPKGSE